MNRSACPLRQLQVAATAGWTARGVRIALLTIDRRDFPGAEDVAAAQLRVVRDPAAPPAAIEHAVHGLLRLVARK